MIFEIIAQHLGTNEKRAFHYDNKRNALSAADGTPVCFPDVDQRVDDREVIVPFGAGVPLRKSPDVQTLKIQLGLSCNYSCDYCSQRFVERPPATNKKDIDAFMRKLDGAFNLDEERPLKIEFWGGEPLVYIKTLMPLVDALNARFAGWERKPRYSIITNGSLLNAETNAWLVANDFFVAVSHDGPGQHVRGPDPLDDPETRAAILDLYATLKPLGRFSFNAMLNASNMSREAIHRWFVDLTGDIGVVLGEGSLVDAYDEGGSANSLNTKAQHFEFRKRAFNDVFSTAGQIGFGSVIDRINSFIHGVLSHSESKYLPQKCGMDSPTSIAVDLHGNVLTCQNVSAVETSMNGKPHLGGNIDDLGAVELHSATHWQNRPACAACPVLHLCKGACMFLDGEHWDTSCANSYSDNIAIFALAFEKMTNGFIPCVIRAPGLPDDRADIWGTSMKHVETPKKKVIPIVAAKREDGTFERAHAEV